MSRDITLVSEDRLATLVHARWLWIVPGQSFVGQHEYIGFIADGGSGEQLPGRVGHKQSP
jgi:hypothetical protein